MGKLTSLKTNNEFTPENGWLEDDPVGIASFQVLR